MHFYTKMESSHMGNKVAKRERKIPVTTSTEFGPDSLLVHYFDTIDNIGDTMLIKECR